MELSERKKAILKSVIDSYIRTGDPVGSKSLTESNQFRLSSATIRSEMNDLESMGYLEQPHTSAGRVPTARGYRTYVDSLMEKYFLGMEELEVLDEVMSGKLVEVGRLMDEAAKAIGQITNYATFAFMGGGSSMVERYEAVFVDENSFLLIMILADGTIRNRHVKLMETITPALLETAKGALNTTLSHLSAEQINLSVILEFEEKMGEAMDKEVLWSEETLLGALSWDPAFWILNGTNPPILYFEDEGGFRVEVDIEQLPEGLTPSEEAR